jgi:hypothetical protein
MMNIITYTKKNSHGHGVTSQVEAVVEDGLFFRTVPKKYTSKVLPVE